MSKWSRRIRQEEGTAEESITNQMRISVSQKPRIVSYLHLLHARKIILDPTRPSEYIVQVRKLQSRQEQIELPREVLSFLNKRRTMALVLQP
jgi:hypothetical protein